MTEIFKGCSEILKNRTRSDHNCWKMKMIRKHRDFMSWDSNHENYICYVSHFPVIFLFVPDWTNGNLKPISPWSAFVSFRPYVTWDRIQSVQPTRWQVLCRVSRVSKSDHDSRHLQSSPDLCATVSIAFQCTACSLIDFSEYSRHSLSSLMYK